MNEEKCTQCGTPAAHGAQYCAACGAAFTGRAPRTGQPTEGASAYAPRAATETRAHYAASPVLQGVAIRFVAQLVDVIILAIIFLILGFSGAGTITINASTAQVSISPFLAAAGVQ